MTVNSDPGLLSTHNSLFVIRSPSGRAGVFVLRSSFCDPPAVQRPPLQPSLCSPAVSAAIPSPLWSGRPGCIFGLCSAAVSAASSSRCNPDVPAGQGSSFFDLCSSFGNGLGLGLGMNGRAGAVPCSLLPVLGWSSPGEKLSLFVVVAAEAVGRCREVGRGPAFHNSAVGRVGRAVVHQAVEK